jgi:hypothetical protein
MKEYKNIKEIVELCKDEIENGEFEISATLDYEDLKELVELYNKNRSLEKEIALMKSVNLEENYIPKSKIKNIVEDLERNGYWAYIEKRDLDLTIERFKNLL